MSNSLNENIQHHDIHAELFDLAQLGQRMNKYTATVVKAFLSIHKVSRHGHAPIMTRKKAASLLSWLWDTLHVADLTPPSVEDSLDQTNQCGIKDK